MWTLKRFPVPHLLLLLIALSLQAAETIHPRRIFLQVAEKDFQQRSLNHRADRTGIPAIDALLAKEDMESVHTAFPHLQKANQDPYGLERIFVLSWKEDQEILRLTARLSRSPAVEYAEPIWLRELYDTQLIPNDPYYESSWHHQTIHSSDAWDIQTGADSILLAIIDTGVDRDHPDLLANLWINPGEIPDNGVDDDSNGFVDDDQGWDFSGSESNSNEDNDVSHDWGWHPWNAEDHGSHCAGIAAAVTNNAEGVAGMAFDARILSVKIFPNAWDDVTSSAIIYAADMGAQVQSNSWGGGGNSNTIQNAILYARNVQDCVVLFAAGNDGSSAPSYPGANNGTVCVGATNSSDNRASFSNYGGWVDMCAPGTGIWSCTDPANPAHNNLYEAWDGTSMATPLAAGVAALIRAQFPAMTVPDVEARLVDGDDVGNLQMGLRLNALKALSAFTISHAPLENTIDTENGYPVSAEIFAAAGADLTVDLYYALSGSDFTSLPMVDQGDQTWQGIIPAQPGGTVIEYYIEVSDGNGNQMTDPPTAPEQPYFFLVGTEGFFSELFHEDAETESGWTLGVGTDDATAGIWVREDPIGTTVGGEPFQPEDDHTPSGTVCFVTGNAPFNGSNYGEQDVDGGITTLVSPLYSIPTNAYAIVSYWRWYSNDLGDNPGSDFWHVQLGDGSGTWLDLENTTASANEWTEHQFLLRNYFPTGTTFHLRFQAEDADGGSLVEAAVDDIRIFVGGDLPFTPGDVNLDTQINIQDLVLIVNHILGINILQGNGALAADYNQDGAVNIQDLITLVTTIIG